MNIQIVQQFTKRTEYKMLKSWISVDERNINELMSGICVIPAIIILKLSEVELQTLNKWWRQWGNQLIVSPPFHQMDIVSLLQLNGDLSVHGIEASSYTFNSIPVNESIKTNTKSKWKLDSGDTVAIHHYEHSGSGCVTLTTVPILDYRLMSKQDICKKLFLELIIENQNEETTIIQESFIPSPVHDYILLLASANVLELTDVSGQLSNFFKVTISHNKALELLQQLIDQKLLEDSGSITDEGEKYINLKGYIPFVREIKRWRRDDGAWR
ncbi:hypothetical protein GLV94_18580 [Virgibacillus halodenitrificans]|uniref:hypothetical protein n=1 Tax=Virgibacillus halodenitrificans TaxID=1482 RepID=UPI00137024FE|nr:hypothetical protein [Virgibacillus halodenitrificans]MYL47649.1 hypothetical protein [Virgibacillus halodenitrificans]